MKTLIRLPVELVNSAQEDLGIEPEVVNVFQFIDVDEIESMCQYPDRNDNLGNTLIRMKSGDDLLCTHKVGVVVEKLRKLTTIVFC